MSKHKAFTGKSKLEIYKLFIAQNTIANCILLKANGAKKYVRKHNVQNYLELHNLIRAAMWSYQSSDLNFKLWKRFWKALNAYKICKTYEEV